MKGFKSIVGQVYSCLIYLRDLLDKNSEYIVITMMLLNGVAYYVICKYYYFPLFESIESKCKVIYEEPEWFEKFYEQGLKFIHGSFLCLLFMSAKCKGYSFLGKFALGSCWAMWLGNEYYLITNDPYNLYFIYFCLVVYISFMVTALYKLTNRC